METKRTQKPIMPEYQEIPQPELIIRPQTMDEEYDRVRFFLKRLPWYAEHGYKLILPNHPVFQQLTQDGADLTPLESTATRELFAKEVYDVDSYAGRLREVEADRPIIEQAFPRFQKLNAQWGFKVFPRYKIALTHFGTLGSYDKKLGIIIVSTQVKRPPKEIAIHEGVHIGIESNIVQSFGILHWEKERVVDLICSLRFGDLLPGYILQPQGNEKINPFITDKNLGDLPKSISEYIKMYPRK